MVGLEAECISPCMTIGLGGEAITAGSEDGVDLVMAARKRSACLADLNRPMAFSRRRIRQWLPSILLLSPLVGAVIPHAGPLPGSGPKANNLPMPRAHGIA